MIHERGVYDYLIVGAGSAGCVLAHRLSADPRRRVLLLEAGGEDRNIWLHVPLGYGRLFDHPRFNWCYRTEPEPGLDERRIDQPRGRVLGGSSSINGLVYIRGQREDFDSWARAGNTGWGYADLLRYFRRAEDQERGADEWHGVGGPLAVSNPRERHPLCDAFIAAASQAGYPLNTDFNGASEEGAGYYQTTSRRGRRCSTAVGYLRQARGRVNLTVVTGAHVRRVLFDGKRAVGVEWIEANMLYRATARTEVVLSAGAINSPQLLQLSGVGPGPLLQSVGVPVIHDSPEVGENLQDHLQVRCVFRARRRITLNDDMGALHRKVWIGLRYLIARKGPLTVSAGLAGGFFRAGAAARPNVQLHCILYSLGKMGGQLDPFPGFTLSSCQLRPTSRGQVRIVSNNPRIGPAVCVNYLSTLLDRCETVAGLRLIRQIAAQPAMAAQISREERPGPAHIREEELLAYARATGGSLYHPACTARMGADPGSVVAPDLRVRGLGSLRVIDASVMPALISGNINAAIIAIAEKGADLIIAAERSAAGEGAAAG